METPEHLRNLFKINDKVTRTTSVTGVFIVNFEQISQIDSIVDFAQVNASWIIRFNILTKCDSIKILP